MKLAEYKIPKKSLNKLKGGILPYIGGALIWALWEIYDEPEDFIKGFKDDVK